MSKVNISDSKSANMFMLALEYASHRNDEGVSYTEVLTFLTDNHMPLDKDLMDNFQWWFFNNFYHPETIKVAKGVSSINYDSFDFTKYYTLKLPLTGEAYLGLLRCKDINALKQYSVMANRNAKKAVQMASIAVWLIGILGFIIIAVAFLTAFLT